MAVMYPTSISKDTESYAEKILFEKFQDQLDDSYSVIHSKNWIQPKKDARLGIEGECDFIVLHAKRGILFIEAKSGITFYCKGVNGDWYCEELGPIKNPIRQVKKSQWALIKFLHERVGEFKLPHSYAIAFPQSDEISDGLPPAIVPEIVILKPDLKNLQDKINQSLSVMRNPLRNPLPQKKYNKIIGELTSEFNITSSISNRISSIRRQFFRLEKDQIEVLDMFEKNNRVLVEGCAGSGKTLIALEKARRLSNEGKSVLFLCYNIPLATEIRDRVTELNINVDVYHFHGLCEKIISDVDGSFEENKSDPNEFWDKECPMQLASAIPQYQKRYDAIITDEGQDFLNEWWGPIKSLLKSPEDGILYIFKDDEQNIFMRPAADGICDQIITLKKNYRNTPAIIEWINKTCKTQIAYSDKIDHGISPEIVFIKNDQEEIQKIANTIKRLVKEPGLSTKSIMILGKYPLDSTPFGKNKKIGKYSVTEESISTQNPDEIRYSSIYRFKGLESDCVLLTGFNKEPRTDIPEDIRSLLLTAATRAKILLYLFWRKN